jgi:periplasmic protein TonB
MFTNLIESDSHRKEFRRRSSFFLVTVAAYALILFASGVASIYAYDARLEAQTTDLTLQNWIPPVTPADHVRPAPPRRTVAANNTGRTAAQPVRTVLYESASNPIKPPDTISAAPNTVQPAPRNAVLGNHDADPIGPPTGTSSGCVTCTGTETGPLVREDTTPPPVPIPVKPKTQTVTSRMLIAKVVSLPKPSYPPMAKEIGVFGPVSVQIVVDEQGKVISAQPVSGHPLLVSAAKEAALRARFTATMLNGQAVKIQGLITYNFALQ